MTCPNRTLAPATLATSTAPSQRNLISARACAASPAGGIL